MKSETKTKSKRKRLDRYEILSSAPVGFQSDEERLFVVLKTNYTWLNASERIYPVSIDPTTRYPNFNILNQITEAGSYNLTFNISDFVIKKISAQAKNWSIKEIQKDMMLLFQVDLLIKSGKQKPNTALNFLVHRLYDL